MAPPAPDLGPGSPALHPESVANAHADAENQIMTKTAKMSRRSGQPGRRIPYVFWHRGEAWHLKYSLRQARHANGKRNVVLLHDPEIRHSIPGIRTHTLDRLPSAGAEEFRASYVHMSTNPRQFEIICWLRWFYVLAYMQTEGLDEIFYLDSDVLPYRSTCSLKDRYGSTLKDCGLIVPRQRHDSFRWNASGGSSYWTVTALSKYCDFALASFRDPDLRTQYERKWRWHKENVKPGGVNDMTGLYMFWRSGICPVTNLARPHEGGTFDAGIHSPDNFDSEEYDFDASSGHKAVELRDGRPFFRREGQPIEAHVLHFAGPARKYLREYYTGPAFPADVLWRLRLGIGHARRVLSLR